MWQANHSLVSTRLNSNHRRDICDDINEFTAAQNLNASLILWVQSLLRIKFLVAFLRVGKIINARRGKGWLQWILLLVKLHNRRFMTKGCKHDKSISERTQVIIKTIQNWCAEGGFVVNPNKLRLVHCTKRQKYEVKRQNLNWKLLIISKQLKYLMITIDQMLTWKS